MPAKKTRSRALEPMDDLPAGLAKPPSERPRRNREWDRKRTRATMDLPPELIEAVKQIHQELLDQAGNRGQTADIDLHEVYAFLLGGGIKAYRSGELTAQLKPAALRLFS